MAGGIEGLLQLRGHPREVQYVRMDAACKTRWAGRGGAQLWQLVVLHNGLDPDLLIDWHTFNTHVVMRVLRSPKQCGCSVERVLKQGRRSEATVSPPDPAVSVDFDVELQGLIFAASKALQMGQIRTKFGFASPIQETFVSFEDFLIWATKSRLKSSLDTEQGVRTRYPWGSYCTPKMARLFVACEHWSKWDRSKLSTGPSTKVLHAALMHAGCKSLAECKRLASIARDPHAKKGRPGKSMPSLPAAISVE